MCEKNEPLFTCLLFYAHFGNLILELNMIPGVLLEPYMSQGDQGVAETPIVSKGLKTDESHESRLPHLEHCLSCTVGLLTSIRT